MSQDFGGGKSPVPSGDPVAGWSASRVKGGTPGGDRREDLGEDIKYVVDAIQKIGLSEELQNIPDARFALKWDLGMFGLKSTMGKGLLLVFLLHLYQALAVVTYVAIGKPWLGYLLLGVFVFFGILVIISASIKPLIISSFVREYIRGPRSRELWLWYMAGTFAGLSGVFIGIGSVTTVFGNIILDMIGGNAGLLNSLLQFAYEILPPDGQARVYEVAVRLYERSKNFLFESLKDLFLVIVLGLLASGALLIAHVLVSRRAKKTQGVKLGPDKRRIFN